MGSKRWIMGHHGREDLNSSCSTAKSVYITGVEASAMIYEGTNGINALNRKEHVAYGLVDNHIESRI